MVGVTYEEASRQSWHRSDGGQPDRDQMQLGCLQRIADSTEAMAKNFIQLQNDRDFQIRRKLDLEKDNLRMARVIRALRGTITRMKRRA